MSETPLPKFEDVHSLGTSFGIMQMSKILHAAKCCFPPIRFALIRRPALVFCAIFWASQFFPFYYDRGRSVFGVKG